MYCPVESRCWKQLSLQYFFNFRLVKFCSVCFYLQKRFLLNYSWQSQSVLTTSTGNIKDSLRTDLTDFKNSIIKAYRIRFLTANEYHYSLIKYPGSINEPAYFLYNYSDYIIRIGMGLIMLNIMIVYQYHLGRFFYLNQPPANPTHPEITI